MQYKIYQLPNLKKTKTKKTTINVRFLKMRSLSAQNEEKAERIS